MKGGFFSLLRFTVQLTPVLKRMELQDLLGITFLKWFVGGDFNVIRRILEKLSGSKLT